VAATAVLGVDAAGDANPVSTLAFGRTRVDPGVAGVGVLGAVPAAVGMRDFFTLPLTDDEGGEAEGEGAGEGRAGVAEPNPNPPVLAFVRGVVGPAAVAAVAAAVLLDAAERADSLGTAGLGDGAGAGDAGVVAVVAVAPGVFTFRTNTVFLTIIVFFTGVPLPPAATVDDDMAPGAALQLLLLLPSANPTRNESP
jgi:hypothetical protein